MSQHNFLHLITGEEGDTWWWCPACGTLGFSEGPEDGPDEFFLPGKATLHSCESDSDALAEGLREPPPCIPRQ